MTLAQHLRRLLAAVLLLPLAAAPALAGSAARITGEAIESASYRGGALPGGQSALTAKVQILLDRAHISPGVIDGWRGGMTESALRAFEAQRGLPVDGRMDEEVWRALGGPEASDLVQSYRITGEDIRGLSDPLPDDYGKLAKLDRLGFERVSERLAERFHMAEDFLLALNPGAGFAAGDSIVVAEPGPSAEAEVTQIEIRKGERRLAAFDAEGRMVSNYPVVIGSRQTPSPSGTYEVVAIALEPTYHYRPDENFQQGSNTEPLTLPPGPNGPVGSVWIDLDKPTYGIHGTGEPSELFKEFSHGCVRMSNWDAGELAGMARAGTSVRFVE